MATRDARALWPSAEDGADFVHWGYLAGHLGWDGGNTPFLIGIRGVFLRETNTHETRHRVGYDDSFVLLTPGNCFEFVGATHAYQLFSSASPDVNHDGKGDVGTIDPGNYLLTYVGRDGIAPLFELTMPDGGKSIPCHRDLDHDGATEPGQYHATSILFHCGPDAPLSVKHKYSVGCQTTKLENLQAMLRAGPVLRYGLITAEDALDYYEGAARKTDPAIA